MLRPFPSSMRAAATTPAEPVGACVARFPTTPANTFLREKGLERAFFRLSDDPITPCGTLCASARAQGKIGDRCREDQQLPHGSLNLLVGKRDAGWSLTCHLAPIHNRPHPGSLHQPFSGVRARHPVFGPRIAQERIFPRGRGKRFRASQVRGEYWAMPFPSLHACKGHTGAGAFPRFATSIIRAVPSSADKGVFHASSSSRLTAPDRLSPCISTSPSTQLSLPMSPSQCKSK